jgi:1-aminocyclopropane-1-carboxylate synthase
MANHMHIHFPTYKPLHPDDLLFANGVTSLCEMIGYSIAEPGDGILLSRPIYQAFQLDFGMKAK